MRPAGLGCADGFRQAECVMKSKPMLGGMLALGLWVTGCETLPPDAQRGPHGTIAYDVLIEASPPGAKIEAEGKIIGETPLHLTIYGDKDGTFHDFGTDFYVIRALPLTTNQYSQIRMFGTGRWFGPEDRIPEQILFDMDQKPPEYVPGSVVYPYPVPYYYPPPFYYGRYYYGGPYYYHHHHYRLGHNHLHVRPRR